jgi:hypothetical protein
MSDRARVGALQIAIRRSNANSLARRSRRQRDELPDGPRRRSRSRDS